MKIAPTGDITATIYVGLCENALAISSVLRFSEICKIVLLEYDEQFVTSKRIEIVDYNVFVITGVEILTMLCFL